MYTYYVPKHNLFMITHIFKTKCEGAFQYISIQNKCNLLNFNEINKHIRMNFYPVTSDLTGEDNS